METLFSVLTNLIAAVITGPVGYFFNTFSIKGKIVAIVLLPISLIIMSLICLELEGILFSPVAFNNPAEFGCDRSVYWNAIEYWEPSGTHICDSSDQYMVSGQVGILKRAMFTQVGVQAINIVDNHETFMPASDGRLRYIETATGKFHIPICLSKQRRNTTLLFSFFAGRGVSKTCMVNIISNEAGREERSIDPSEKIVTSKNSTTGSSVPLETCRNGDGIIEGEVSLMVWVNSQQPGSSDLFCISARSEQGSYKKCYVAYNDCIQHREGKNDCLRSPISNFVQHHYKFYDDPPMICFSTTQ